MERQRHIRPNSSQTGMRTDTALFLLCSFIKQTSYKAVLVIMLTHSLALGFWEFSSVSR